ncbi:MAG: DsrE family protein [Gammaproteobacteria bacterium]|nr:DsrE family protein [Gammaproteobacteria bacterium]MDH5730220.1 DsrE family protein [Gammaproteobacteria bacterium]
MSIHSLKQEQRNSMSSIPQEMKSDEAKKLFIILSTGMQDAGKKATLAFSAACSALALDKSVSVFLIGDGVVWADQNITKEIITPGFPPLDSLIDNYIEFGGHLAMCSACASDEGACGIEEYRLLKSPSLRAEVQVQGFATIMENVFSGSNLSF